MLFKNGCYNISRPTWSSRILSLFHHRVESVSTPLDLGWAPGGNKEVDVMIEVSHGSGGAALLSLWIPSSGTQPTWCEEDLAVWRALHRLELRPHALSSVWASIQQLAPIVSHVSLCHMALRWGFLPKP